MRPVLITMRGARSLFSGFRWHGFDGLWNNWQHAWILQRVSTDAGATDRFVDPPIGFVFKSMDRYLVGLYLLAMIHGFVDIEYSAARAFFVAFSFWLLFLFFSFLFSSFCLSIYLRYSIVRIISCKILK